MAVRRSYATIMEVLRYIVINAFLPDGFVRLKFIATRTWNSGVCIRGHARSKIVNKRTALRDPKTPRTLKDHGVHRRGIISRCMNTPPCLRGSNVPKGENTMARRACCYKAPGTTAAWDGIDRFVGPRVAKWEHGVDHWYNWAISEVRGGRRRIRRSAEVVTSDFAIVPTSNDNLGWRTPRRRRRRMSESVDCGGRMCGVWACW